MPPPRARARGARAWAPGAGLLLLLAAAAPRARAQDPPLFRTYEDSEGLTDSVPEIPGAVEYEVGCEPAKASSFYFTSNSTEEPNTFVYVPAPNQFSSDFRDRDVFSYYGVYDDGTKSDLQVAFVYIFPVNDPPVAGNGEEYVIYNGVSDGIVPNQVEDEQKRLSLRYPYALERQLVASDPDGDRLHYEVIVPPVHGNVSVDSDGNFKYVPLNGYTGEDRFSYSVDDRLGNGKADGKNDPYFSDNATVVVLVGVEDGLPLVLPDAFSTLEDVPLVNQPISRGATSNAALVPLIRYRVTKQGSFGVATPACEGKEVLDPATCEEDAERRISGRAYFTYVPNRDAFGTDEFEIELYVEGQEAQFPPGVDQRAVITIEIMPVNDAPVAYPARGESAMYNPQAGTYNASASAVPVRIFDVDSPAVAVKLRVEPIKSWFEGYDAPDVDAYGVEEADVGTFYAAIDPATGAPVGSPLNLRGSGITVNVDGADAPGGMTVMLYHVPPPFKRGHPIASILVEVSDGELLSNRTEVTMSTKCVPGFSVDEEDLGLCAPCERGTYSIPPDASACSMCPAGYSSAGQATQCDICRPGTYAPTAGSPRCLSCGYGATSPAGSTDMAACYCLRGHFGGLGRPCLACPNPKVPRTDGLKVTINQTLAGLMKDGLAVEGDINKIAEAAAISVYAQYENGEIKLDNGDRVSLWTKCIYDNQTLPLPFEGFYVGPRTSDSSVVLRECSPPNACRDLKKESDTALIQAQDTCAKGYRGAACAVCEDGYFRISGRCAECPAGGVQAGTIFAWIFVMALPLMLRFVDFDIAYPMLDIIIAFTQTTSIYLKMNLNWPQSLRNFFEAASIFNLNWELLHIDCQDSSWTFGKKWSYTMIQPWIILGLVFVMQLLNLAHKIFQRTIGVKIRTRYPWLIEPPEASDNKLKRFASLVRYGIGKFLIGRVFRTAGVFKGKSVEEFVSDLRTGFKGHLTLLHMQYVYLTVGAFEMWECLRDEVTGDFYLFSEPGVKCFDTSGDGVWASLYPYAVITIIALPFGIPLCFGALLFMFRNPDVRKTEAAKQLLGFLYVPYEEEWYAWEITRFLRILGLTAAAMMFQGGRTQSNDPDTAALNELLLAASVLAINLGGQYYARPYEDVRLDRAQSVAAYSNFFTLFCGLAFVSPRTSKSVRDGLELANLIFFGVSYAIFLYTLVVVVFPGAAKALTKYYNRYKRRQAIAKGEASAKITSLFDTEYMVRGFAQKMLVGNNIASYLVRLGADVVIYLNQAKLVELRELKAIFSDLKNHFDKLKGNKLSVIATAQKPDFEECFVETERTALMEGLAVNAVASSNIELRDFVDMLEGRHQERNALHKRMGANLQKSKEAVKSGMKDLKETMSGKFTRSMSGKSSGKSPMVEPEASTSAAKEGGVFASMQKSLSMKQAAEPSKEDAKDKAPAPAPVEAEAEAPAVASTSTAVDIVPAPAPQVVEPMDVPAPAPEAPPAPAPEAEAEAPPAPAPAPEAEAEAPPEPEPKPEPAPLVPAQTAPPPQVFARTPASPERLKLEEEARTEAEEAARLADERLRALEEAERLARERALALEEAAASARAAALAKARAAALCAEAEEAERVVLSTEEKTDEAKKSLHVVEEIAKVVAEADALNEEKRAMEAQMQVERFQFLEEKAKMEDEIRRQMEELEAMQAELDGEDLAGTVSTDAGLPGTAGAAVGGMDATIGAETVATSAGMGPISPLKTPPATGDADDAPPAVGSG